MTINIEKLKLILSQYWWPIKLNYQTKTISCITHEIVMFHRENIQNIEKYSVNELFTLYHVLLHAINDLWEEEFNTVTWLDLYKDWYTTLNWVKRLLINNSD